MERHNSAHSAWSASSSSQTLPARSSTASFTRKSSTFSRLFSFSTPTPAPPDDLLPFPSAPTPSDIDWPLFQSEENAVRNLADLVHRYQTSLRDTATAGAAATEALLTFFPPDREHVRDAAATVHETYLGFAIDAGAKGDGDVESRFEEDVVAPLGDLVSKMQAVREMARARNEMVHQVKKYEAKHEARAVKAGTAPEKLEESAGKLKEAINKYCELEKEIGAQCKEVHENFGKLVDPILEGFIEHQARMYSYGLFQMKEARRDLARSRGVNVDHAVARMPGQAGESRAGKYEGPTERDAAALHRSSSGNDNTVSFPDMGGRFEAADRSYPKIVVTSYQEESSSSEEEEEDSEEDESADEAAQEGLAGSSSQTPSSEMVHIPPLLPPVSVPLPAGEEAVQQAPPFLAPPPPPPQKPILQRGDSVQFDDASEESSGDEVKTMSKGDSRVRFSPVSPLQAAGQAS